MQKHSSRTVILWSLISFAITMVIGGSVMAIWQRAKPCPVAGEKRIWGNCYRDLQAKPLTVGIANPSPNEDYQALATYLQNQLGIQVAIDQDTPFAEISARIAQKDWDVAFTRSPIFSIAAEDHGYSGAAIMFPEQPLYYRAALYVRADSPIQSIADIKPTTTIALGSPESAPTFLLPIYALYGKSVRVGRGYQPRETVELVKAGKVDIGAGRYAAIKADRTLRIIYVSKAIPGAGVYLSPKLLGLDRERLKATLLNANPEVKAKANYDAGQTPNYDELRKIRARTEEILNCLGSDVNSLNLQTAVNLFCQETILDQTIKGQVREYKIPTANNIEFTVVTDKNQVYIVLVSQEMLEQISINSVDAVDEYVQLKGVKPRRLADGVWQVKITQPNQLSMINN